MMPNALKLKMTPAERRRRKVRTAIVEAAEKMFMRDGEAGLSIRKIAHAIDYTPGAIYKYFESKQDLVDALKEAFFELLLDEMEEFSGDREAYLDYARRFMGTYIRIAMAKPHHYAAAFTGFPKANAPTTKRDEKSLKVQAFFKLQTMVETGVNLNVFRQDLNVLNTSKSIWASLHGFAALMSHIPNFQNTLSDDETLSQEEFIRRHIDFILQGLS